MRTARRTTSTSRKSPTGKEKNITSQFPAKELCPLCRAEKPPRPQVENIKLSGGSFQIEQKCITLDCHHYWYWDYTEEFERKFV